MPQGLFGMSLEQHGESIDDDLEHVLVRVSYTEWVLKIKESITGTQQRIERRDRDERAGGRQSKNIQALASSAHPDTFIDLQQNTEESKPGRGKEVGGWGECCFRERVQSPRHQTPDVGLAVEKGASGFSLDEAIEP